LAGRGRPFLRGYLFFLFCKIDGISVNFEIPKKIDKIELKVKS